MSYTLSFTEQARKSINKLDKYSAKVIMAWIYKNLVGCENPRSMGKGLVGNHSGEWRYRVGDYRIIVDVQDSELIVLVIMVGHRKSVH